MSDRPKRQKPLKKSPPAGSRRRRTTSAGRERVLIEFPTGLLQRATEAATTMEKNRSELIRTAVEKYLEEMKKQRFEAELAAGYAANAERNLELAEEFAHVDRESF